LHRGFACNLKDSTSLALQPYILAGRSVSSAVFGGGHPSKIRPDQIQISGAALHCAQRPRNMLSKGMNMDYDLILP
jgi:hypothetical protein